MNPPEIRLRLATPADAPLLRAWDTQPHVIAASGGDDRDDWDQELAREVTWREFLIAEADGVPVGAMQVIDPAEEETHYWGTARPTCAPSTSGSARRNGSGAAWARG